MEYEEEQKFRAIALMIYRLVQFILFIISVIIVVCLFFWI